MQMFKFLACYRGDRRSFHASNHVVARRLANAAYRAEFLEEPDTAAIVIIDVEASGYSAFDAAWQVLVCETSIKVEQSVVGLQDERVIIEFVRRCIRRAAALTQAEKRYTESDWAAIQRDEIDSAASIWECNGQRQGERSFAHIKQEFDNA